MRTFAGSAIISILLLIVCPVKAQENQTFQLPEGAMRSEQSQLIGGAPVWKQYEREWRTMEGSDSIVYLETYLKGRYWRLNRYTIIEGKPRLTGWQKEFDQNGLLEEQLLCEGSRRCNTSVRFYYYPGGQLMSLSEYEKNKRHGAYYMFYSDGQLRQYILFEYDKMLEIMAYYDAQGNPLDPGTLCDGDGYANVYSLNGMLIERKHFIRGRLVREEHLQ